MPIFIPFWGYDFIDKKRATTELSRNMPEKAEPVFVCDKPWEGTGSDFFNLFFDSDFKGGY